MSNLANLQVLVWFACGTTRSGITIESVNRDRNLPQKEAAAATGRSSHTANPQTSCLHLIISIQKPTCWNFASSRPGSVMPGPTVRLAAHRGHHRKYHAPVCLVGHSKLAHIGTAIHDTGSHRILSTISWKGHEDGRRSSIMWQCK